MSLHSFGTDAVVKMSLHGAGTDAVVILKRLSRFTGVTHRIHIAKSCLGAIETQSILITTGNSLSARRGVAVSATRSLLRPRETFSKGSVTTLAECGGREMFKNAVKSSKNMQNHENPSESMDFSLSVNHLR